MQLCNTKPVLDFVRKHSLSVEDYSGLESIIYDQCYSHKSDDLAFYESFIRRHKVKRLLDIGSGTGRIAIGLSDKLEQVVALEPVADMLARTPQADNIKPVLGSAESFDDEAQFDLAIFGHNGFTHLLDSLSRQAALQNISRSLKPGGHLIIDIDVFDYPPLSFESETFTVEEEQILRLCWQEFEQDGGHLTRTYLYLNAANGKVLESCVSNERDLTLCELEHLMELTGLRLKQHLGDYWFAEFDAAGFNERNLLVLEKSHD